MIYTVTFNPAIDYVIKVDNLTLGQVNRQQENTFSVEEKVLMYLICLLILEQIVQDLDLQLDLQEMLLNQERKNLDLNQILSESVKE